VSRRCTLFVPSVQIVTIFSEVGVSGQTVTVNQLDCVGSASCVAIAPGVFALDDDRLSRVVDLLAAPWPSIEEAAETCPVAAITIDDGTGTDHA
jgi:ferredoxin